jgi:hypothetical protein
MDCPRGAVCLFDGSTLERTYAGEGFWQPDNVTREYLECAAVFNDRKLAAAASLRCCSSTARCNATLPRSESWSPDAQCEDGYAGPLCVLCADNFVLYDNECISCDGGSPLWVGVVGLLGVGGGIFFVSVIMLKKTTTRKDSTHETRATRITGIASIIISWLQILSALTVTYKMAWPSSFVTYSQASGSVVNMEILSLLAIGNCALAVPFLNKFLLQLLTPPIFVAAVILAYFCVSGFRCLAKGAQIDQTNGARLDKTVNLAVIIMQLLYPKLATRTFQMLRCQDLGPSVGMLLESDYSVTCHEGLHDQFVSLAVLSILGYLIGVPLATFVVLWRNRERLHMKDVESRFGDLYRPYEDKWAFWEVVLMVQKCMLTGAMCAIAPGSPLQLFIAMGICAMYLLLLTFARPYKGLLEDQLAFMTSLVLTVSLCLGFALNTDAVDPEERVFSIDLCGWVLIILNIMPFVYVIFASVQVLRHGPDFLIDGQGAATATGRPAEKGLPQKDSSNAVEKKKNRVLVRPVPGGNDEETDAPVKAEGKENTYGEEDIIHWGRPPRPAADGNSGWGDFPEVASDGGSGTSPATVSTS